MCECCDLLENTDQEISRKVQSLTNSLNRSTEDLTTLIYDDQPFDGVLEIIVHKVTEIKRLREKIKS